MATEIADTRIATMMAMLDQARRTHDALVRAQILAETQYQAAWALREAVVDSQDADRSWAEIGRAIGLPRDTAWRQYKAGGPLVTVKPYQSADSPLADSQPKPFTGATALYAFRTGDGAWFGPDDQVADGEYRTGWMAFDPPNAPGSRFAGQELLVRHGPWDGDVSFHAALIRDTATGSLERVRATYEVIDWLFGDGQTAIRQALTAVAHAAVLNPLLDPKLRGPIDAATTLQGRDVPVADFIAAAEQVAENAVLGYRAGQRLSHSLHWLERAVRQYRTWEARPGTAKP